MNSRPNKPDYLGEQFASRFQDQGVVDRYHLRPAYPPETFHILSELIVDEPRAVLDVGCGSGDIARHLVDFVERIDAVDVSLPMLEKGKTLPGGDSPKIRWLHGKIEEIPLEPPYALITAGRSLHWMDWDSVMPRFAHVLTPHGALAIVYAESMPTPWQDDLRKLIRRYSTNPFEKRLHLIEELEKRRLFQKQGEASTAPINFEQSIDEFIEGLHSRSSLTRGSMKFEDANAFDRQVRELLSSFLYEGKIAQPILGNVVWGKPISPGANSR